MKKQCQAHVKSNGAQCQKNAMRGSRYCFWHQSWGVNVLGAIILLIAGAFLGPPAQALWEKCFSSDKSDAIKKEIRGMAEGGDAYAEINYFMPDVDSSTLGMIMFLHGEYPLRQVRVKVVNESKRINAEKAQSRNISPSEIPSEIVLERFIGDITTSNFVELGSIQLNPSITNFFRLDIGALNGSSWELVSVHKNTNTWAIKDEYYYRKTGDKTIVLPKNLGGMIYTY